MNIVAVRCRRDSSFGKPPGVGVMRMIVYGFGVGVGD